VSSNKEARGQTTISARTRKDRAYLDILDEHGRMTNAELLAEAGKQHQFLNMKRATLDKDVDRFVTDFTYLGIIEKRDGKLRRCNNGQQNAPARTYHVGTFEVNDGAVLTLHNGFEQIFDRDRMEIVPGGDLLTFAQRGYKGLGEIKLPRKLEGLLLLQKIR
jgi:hypothetical protein